MQAETDRDLVRRVWAADEREKVLMKDVKGWKMGSVYHSDRFVLFRLNIFAIIHTIKNIKATNDDLFFGNV